MAEDTSGVRLPARRRRAGGILRAHVKASIHPKDWELLAILQSEGKATYADLARRVNLSQTAVHERVKKLEARGLIRGYCAMVDPAALGLPVTAFVFVEQQPGPNGTALPERFAELPEVVACHSIAGDESFLLKVRVADNSELERVIARDPRASTASAARAASSASRRGSRRGRCRRPRRARRLGRAAADRRRLRPSSRSSGGRRRAVSLDFRRNF